MSDAPAPDGPTTPTEPGADRVRRPFLVWLIVAFVFLSAAWSISGVWLLYSVEETGDLGDGVLTLRQAIGPVDLAFMGVLVLLNLLAAVALFRMRRSAAMLFGLVLAVTLLNQLWMFLFNPAVVAAQGPIAGIVGVVLPLLFFLYSSRLARRGVLS